MRGYLEPNRTARLPIELSFGTLDFEIDTGFDGELIIGDELFDDTEAERVGTVNGHLAAGNKQRFLKYVIAFEWMGELTQTYAMVCPGNDCLIGTALLEPHRLEIDYEQRTVELIRGSSW